MSRYPGYPFLQGRSFVFASQYAKRLPDGLASQYINAAVEVLEASEAGVPVKVSVVKAIRKFVPMCNSLTSLSHFPNSFCAQVEDSLIVSLAPRIIKDLGPFLLVTSEDTLVLVLEAIGVVVQIADGKWLEPELAQLLSQAVLEVWTKNIKGARTYPGSRCLLLTLSQIPFCFPYLTISSRT
jgi:importin-9